MLCLFLYYRRLREERLEMLRKELKKNTELNHPNFSFEKVCVRLTNEINVESENLLLCLSVGL
jgi:hypothetical protein